MALNIGNNAVANAFVGSSQVRRAYKGGTLVYQGFGPASELEFIQKEATGGPAQLLKVYGKSIVNNQLVKNGDFSTSDLFWNNQGYNSLLSIANGSLVVEATRTAGVWIHYREGELVGGHKYLFLLSVYSAVSCYLTLRLTYSGSNIVNYSLGTITTASTQKAQIADMPADPFDFSLYTTGNVNIGDKFYFDNIFAIDLTLLYGAGNEPTSVAQFEADYPEYNPTYDPGSLQSNKTSLLRAYDGGNLRGSLALNLSTLTGKLNGEGASVVVFPDGLRGVGSIRDDAEGSTGVVRLGKRAYQTGDESDTSVLTDGTNTIYPLATPLTYTLDTPLPTDLTCEQGDILQRVSDNNCPFVGKMRFGL